MTSASQRRMGRRDFVSLTVKGAGAVGFAIVGGKFLVERLGGIPPDVRTQTADPRAWVMVIDLDRCDGCGVCTTACRNTHDVPDGQEWIKIYEVNEPDGAHYFLPRPCMHCDNAPCVAVCPVNATFRRDDGLVLIDRDVCIGCGYCIEACPYGARHLNPVQKTADKCTLCAHRLEAGQGPACVATCIGGALTVGDLNDPESDVSQLLAQYPVATLKPEQGTDPMFFYIALDGRLVQGATP